MNCIFVIALSVLLVALAVAEPIDKTRLNECAKELNLTEDEINRIYPDAVKNPSGNLKCFSKCFLEKSGFLKDGVIQPAWYKQIIDGYDKETAKAFVDKCSAIKAEDKCEMAIKFVMCNDEFTTKARSEKKEN